MVASGVLAFSMSDDEGEGDAVQYQIIFEGEKQAKAFVSRNGKAKATFPNQDVFDGDYQDGLRHGKGTYVWSKAEESKTRGAKYDGDYKAGKKDGAGVFTYPDKSKYLGQWKSDQRHGKGTYVYPNGDRYCGAWELDMKEGPGTYLYAASQTQLTGNFKGGVCNDGVWSYYDGKNFACTYSDSRVVDFDGRTIV
jgi:radial spoke head protein 1